jgi:adenosylcobinamide-GDP ribazoletransferase
LVFAFQFFTNLPWPGRAAWNEKNAAASLTWLPLTGLAIGLALVVFQLFCQRVGFPRYAPLGGLLLLALDLWVGGGLLLDGFCDSCDGLLSRREKDRALAIMSDSHLGAMGALGLFLALAAKLLLLVELSAGPDFLLALLFYPCWGRWAVAFAAFNFQTAKATGMAYFFKAEQKPARFILPCACVILPLPLLPPYFSLAAVCSAAGLLLLCSRLRERLGGLTGDTYGLASVAAELTFLLFAAVFAGVL